LERASLLAPDACAALAKTQVHAIQHVNRARLFSLLDRDARPAPRHSDTSP
jgi:hypothetical protein